MTSVVPATPSQRTSWPLVAVAALFAETVAYMLQSMSAAALVREAREEAGLSRSALAARAGVPTSTVSRIEDGSSDPTLTMLARLIAAAGRHLSVSIVSPQAGSARPAIELLTEACRPDEKGRKVD